MSRYVADDYAGMRFSCHTCNDCDRIDRVQFERTDSSLCGALITLTRDPVFYDLERRLVYGTQHITIFVRGQAFSSLEEAKAVVAELEVAAKAIVDAPHNMVARLGSGGGDATSDAATEEAQAEPMQLPAEGVLPEGPPIDPDKAGMPCDEYCKSLEPVRLGYPGDIYPDCTCDCGRCNAFVGLNCVPCSEMCAGSDTFLYTPDPMRYCDRINAGIHELEQQAEGQMPVIRGLGIEVRPSDASVSIGPLQTDRAEGAVSIRGERTGSTATAAAQVATDPPPLVEITVAPDAPVSAETATKAGSSSQATLLWISLGVIGVLVVVVPVLLILVLRRQR